MPLCFRRVTMTTLLKRSGLGKEDLKNIVLYLYNLTLISKMTEKVEVRRLGQYQSTLNDFNECYQFLDEMFKYHCYADDSLVYMTLKTSDQWDDILSLIATLT